MPSSMIRRSIWGVTAIALIAVLVVAALPWIASTRIIQDRIALELSVWSGYRVELASAPEVHIWPTFKAVLNDVSLSDWDDSAHRPVLDAESVELELSPIAALQGNVRISTARLVRPVLYVSEVAPGRYAPVAPRIGRIWRALESARALVSANPTQPDLSLLPDDPFGTVEFSDGQVVDVDGGKHDALMTGLAGAVEWSALDATANLSASGVWRGENFSLDASSRAPLILLAGGTAPLTFNLKAAPASGSFDGIANLSRGSYLNGQLAFSSPSLRRMLEWSRTDLPPGAASGSVALSGKISGNKKRFKLDNAQLTLDGNPGSGVLELSLARTVPAISGTLAFDKLDLRSFVSAFTPFTLGSDITPSAIDIAFAEKYSLDLRLSAANASAGEFAFTNVAATAQVKGDLTAFDISDATIFGGTLQAGVRYDRKGDGGNLDVRLFASDIDTAAAAGQFKQARPVPTGKATVSLLLKGPGRDRTSFLETATGTFSATYGPGTVTGFDLAAFMKRVNQGGFFPLHEVAAGSVAVDRAEVRATLAEGAARIETAEVRLGERTVTFSGAVPYVGRGLALSGAVVAAKAAADQPDAAEASFFVGGSWASPFVSPMFSGTAFETPRLGQSD
jgi:AsmA protein